MQIYRNKSRTNAAESAIRHGFRAGSGYYCYPKAEKKGRERREVIEVTSWLTGYTDADIEAVLLSDVTYGDFFRNAPSLNPKRTLITGVVCGVRVESVEEPLMREIRYLG